MTYITGGQRPINPRFNYHWYLNFKWINLFFLNGGSKLIYIIKIFIYVKID